VYVLVQSRLCLSFSSTQPKNLENAISLEIGLMHVVKRSLYKNDLCNQVDPLLS
jgi:hypothetical protein